MKTGWSSGSKTYLFRSALISAAPRIPGLEDDAPFPRLRRVSAAGCGLFRAVVDFFAAFFVLALCVVKFSTISVLNLERTKFVRSAYEFSTLGVRI
jgi:hypothetical protein